MNSANPEEMPEMNVREFADSFHHIYKAVEFGGNPFPNPSNFGLAANSRLESILHKVGLAVVQRYKDRKDEGFVFMIRFYALMEICGKDQAQEWITFDPSGKPIYDDSLLQVAATCPLTKEGKFQDKEFFDRLENSE